MEEAGKWMKFISEKQVEELRATKGDRVEDGTLTVDKPLYEVLKEAKDKKQEDFEEKYLKHKPPKALDEDETEFLEAVEKHKREREKEQAEEEAREMTNFQAALAGRTIVLHEEIARPPPIAKELTKRDDGSKQKRLGDSFLKLAPTKIKVLPVTKKPKIGIEGSQATTSMASVERKEGAKANSTDEPSGGLLGLVSYGTDDEDDD